MATLGVDPGCSLPLFGIHLPCLKGSDPCVKHRSKLRLVFSMDRNATNGVTYLRTVKDIGPQKRRTQRGANESFYSMKENGTHCFLLGFLGMDSVCVAFGDNDSSLNVYFFVIYSYYFRLAILFKTDKKCCRICVEMEGNVTMSSAHIRRESDG